MKKLPILISGCLLAAGLLMTTSVGFSKPEYTKKEKKACTTCHVDAKKTPKELKDVGKCYGEKKDLKECMK